MVETFFYHNEKYTLPREDAMAVDAGRRIFVAADGVTRDFGGVFEGRRPYPDPSPATAAADAVAQTALAELQCGASAGHALEVANAAVDRVNHRLGIWERCDWLEYDPAGAVAAVSRVEGDTLTMGWIGDCGVAVVRDGALAHLTRDQLDEVLAYLAANPAPYDDPRRAFIRGTLRNRPDNTEDGRRITYGVLTGEAGATAYIETEAFALQPGDVVATHTDGFRPYFHRHEFLAALSGAPVRWSEAVPTVMAALLRESHEFGKERSLILYRHNGEASMP